MFVISVFNWVNTCTGRLKLREEHRCLSVYSNLSQPNPNHLLMDFYVPVLFRAAYIMSLVA